MSKTLLLIGLATLLGSLVYLQAPATTSVSSSEEIPIEVQAAYNLWKVENNKKYSSQENRYRLGVFYDNLQTIEQHNSNPQRTYDLGQTLFMDLTQEEFVATYLIQEEDAPEVVDTLSAEEITNSVNWKDKITPVKDQGRCGSCWAFSATGAIEAVFKVVKGQEVLLSEQQLVDCFTGSSGCNGGSKDGAIKYAAQVGLQSEAEYPYTARDGQCQTQSGSVKPKGVNQISATTSDLQKAIAQYPVAVSVDATNWSLYKGGVFNSCKNDTHNHAVLAVGFNDDGSWIVKNSWSTKWGEDGHIRLAAGNTCGVMATAYQAF